LTVIDLTKDDPMQTLQGPADLLEATRRVEAANALLARGILGLAPLDECAEAAFVWLGQADVYMRRAA
jgi:hypothetical protein